jgi:hypothetical protein
MLVFQDSRRQLVSTLINRLDAAKQSSKPGDEAQERRIISLSKAIEAADK